MALAAVAWWATGQMPQILAAISTGSRCVRPRSSASNQREGSKTSRASDSTRPPRIRTLSAPSPSTRARSLTLMAGQPAWPSPPPRNSGAHALTPRSARVRSSALAPRRPQAAPRAGVVADSAGPKQP